MLCYRTLILELLFQLMFLDVRNLTPADAAIIRPLLKSLTEKWHILGSLLGFDTGAIKKIRSSGGDDESYLNSVIDRWLCGDASQLPTLERLIAALRNPQINGETIVAELLKGN